jgi:hypothetical protein
MSDNPLTPAQCSMRASIAANARWSKLNKSERLAATKPGRDAAFEKLLDEVDRERELPEDERLMLARNAQKAQMDRVRLAASRARTRRRRVAWMLPQWCARMPAVTHERPACR